MTTRLAGMQGSASSKVDSPARRLAGRLPRLGLSGTVALATVLALLALPLANLQPNRILSGVGYRLWQWPQPATAALVTLVFVALALAAGFVRQRTASTMVAGAGAGLLLAAAGAMATALLTGATPFARVSLGSGFWIALLGFGLIAADGLVKLSLKPLTRVAVTMLAVAAAVAILASEVSRNLSIMREYRNYADSFWAEAAQHLVLVFGSLVPAVLIGIPLGYLCHRSPAARAAALPVLEVVQTIPSIAMFGLLMAPLAALALAFPALGELGIRGIGATPALIALILYSLLPVVANTLAGFRSVDPAVVEAARGMGMSPRRRLFSVEWPLALPVVVTGIRVVLVQNIGLVAIAALIGAGGLGSFIFRGMNQTAMDLVLLGAVPILGLALASAIVLDAVTEMLESRG
ncbi:MAG TPA: ABC transporter permease [Microvirga sp.]|nr:ABC transporter permease [Microvirga sp.]